MRMIQTNQKIETLRFFPFFAWATVILFAFFVYQLTMELKDVVTDLQQSVSRLEEKVNTPAGEIENFEGEAPTLPTETTPPFSM